MNVQTLPRTVVSTYLSVARLPLTAAAKVSGQAKNDQWAPALAFEGFEASVETRLGSLLRNSDLRESGRVRRAKVDKLRAAAKLEAAADAKRDLAQRDVRRTRETAAAKRKAATQRAEQREQNIEREAAQRVTQAEQKAAKQTVAAEQTKIAEEKVIERRERAAAEAALAQEADALKTQQEALDAAETVETIDETIEGNKEARNVS